MPDKICKRIVNMFDHLLAILLPVPIGVGIMILLVNWATKTNSGVSEAVAIIGSLLSLILCIVWFVGIAMEEMRISNTPAIAIEFLKGIKESLVSFGNWLFS